MEDEEVGEGVGEEEGQAEEEEEAVGEGRDGGAGGRDGEEGRDAGCFFISQLLFEDDAQRNMEKRMNGGNVPLSRYWLYFSMLNTAECCPLLDR